MNLDANKRCEEERPDGVHRTVFRHIETQVNILYRRKMDLKKGSLTYCYLHIRQAVEVNAPIQTNYDQMIPHDIVEL
jgi:hypothetical protein